VDAKLIEHIAIIEKAISCVPREAAFDKVYTQTD